MGSTEVAPELKLERVRFRVWRGEELRAQGRASHVSIRRDTNHATAADVRAELPARGQAAIVTAPAAEGDLASQVFTAQGGVVLIHGDERATTDRARYEPGPSGRGIIWGRDPVVVERGDDRQESQGGFRYDLQSGDLEFVGPVTGRGRVAGGRK
jgi:lipopolysaccharide export system protein LptC